MTKKEMIRTRSGIGYEMTSIDTRVERQFGTATLLWLQDFPSIQLLQNDLQRRLRAKRRKEAERAPA